MKRILPTFLAITLLVLIFTSCEPLFPLDKDQFDFGDTVKVYVGETVYESEEFWLRVDSVHDARCPEGVMCVWAGEAKVWLSVGNHDSVEQFQYSTFFDSLRTNIFCVGGLDVEVTLLELKPLPTTGISLKRKWASFKVGYMITDRKPNLYLYPEKKTKLNVSMDFPHGGGVIESDPAYPGSWQNIKVKPDGKINKKYDYLYYECKIPDFWQYSEGWVVKQENLTQFFTDNLKAYGFIDSEIEDFIEFWIPELSDAPNYEIFPQYTEMVNRVIKLWISPRPQSLMRLHYVIKATDDYFSMPEPEIPEYKPEGFVAREWGVILK